MSRIAQADPGVRAYFLGDALNSARQMVDNAGQIGLGRAYEPFGDLFSIAGEMQTAYGFAGEWRDTTGLVNLRARYYAPTNGRFLQPDPWEGEKTNPPTQSKYLYALNSPILITDPSGRVCIGGYSLGSGEGCSAAYQGQVKGAIDKWARLMGNPEFLRGLVYEFLEALIVVGPDTQRAVLNYMLREPRYISLRSAEIRA
jgi:RHS repeat-associated protein